MNPPSTITGVRHDAEEAASLFPALLVEAEHIAQTLAAGLHGRRRAGPGETFWQHRPYTFGDPVSAIDWRQSARVANRLYIRQNEWEAAAVVYIWRDPSRSLDYASIQTSPTKRRRADVLAAALTILLARAGERIGILGGARRSFQGRGAAERFLEALHVDEFDNTASAPPLANVTPGARIVLISDFFTEPEAIQSAINAFAAAGAKGVLVQICDRAEEEFPFSGRVEFNDPESKDRLLFGEAGAISETYKAKFQAHREALATLTSRIGWTFVSHRTDRPAQTTLLSIYAALADQRAWRT